MTATDPAVQAAAEALRAASVAELRRALRAPTGYLTPEECAEAAVAAARPHIAAAVRAEAAAEILAACPDLHRDGWNLVCGSCSDAARIAKGGAR